MHAHDAEVMAIDVPFAQLPEEHPLRLDAAAIGGGGDGQIATGTVRLKYVDDGIQETIEWKDRPIVQDTDIKEGPTLTLIVLTRIGMR